MRNLELKARRNIDWAIACKIATDVGAVKDASLKQEDVYFHCPFGRLKIRRENGNSHGQLVSYVRENFPEARLSHYQVVKLPGAEQVIQALEQTLGIRVIVRKDRLVYLWKNVRIHIDEVEGLGNFIEFEAVLDDSSDMNEAKEDLEFLLAKYEVDEDDWISDSYSEMLLAYRMQHQDTPA